MPSALPSSDIRKDVERFLELGRRIKALETERRDLGGVLLAHIDAEALTLPDGRAGWEDAVVACFAVESPGRVSADVAALQKAGLHEYLKVGEPVRYFGARWK